MPSQVASRALVVVTLLVLTPALAFAQASVAGVVRDASGAVLPGVTIEVSSPALIEKTRTVVSGADGQYRVIDLRPGVYTVTFTLTGFSTVRREGLELSGSLNTTVDADMRIGAVEETITVAGETPLVDVQSVQRQWVLDKEIIDTLPTGRTTINVAALIPGMTLSTTFSGEGQDVGGNTGEVQQTLSIHGSRGGDMRRMVDGLSMQSQGTSVSAFAANSGMIQEVTVDTAAGSAEQSAGGVRMNIIPREGGNMFSGSLFLSGTNENLQSNNIDDDLRALGLVSTSSVKSNWEVNPAFGGPLVRDRLWFFASGRSSSVNNYIANSVANLNAGDRNSFAFAPDTSVRGSRDTLWQNVNARFTWQMDSKNKVSLFIDAQDRCSCIDSRALTSREASADFRFPWKRLVTATYSAPITSKILLEAGYAHKPEDWGYFTPEGLESFEQFVGITNQATGVFYRGPRPYFINSMRFKAELMDDSWRGAMSYVTGAHAFKAGYQAHQGRTLGNYNMPVAANLSYTFNGLTPVSITQRAPYTAETHVHDGGVYAQDRWTIDRLTLNLGVRWDFYSTNYPAQTLGPTVYTPNRNVTFPAGDLASLNDVTPKLGVAYDLFGNGKTALKASLSKYVEQLTYTGTYGDSANPTQRTVQAVTRQWNDIDTDFTPDCDLTNPLLNGECLQISNLAFGNPIPSTTYNPDVLSGWGQRGYNWETSVSVQHELVQNVYVDAGYYRRWYGNFLATDNRALLPGDFTPFSVTAPSDSRLPNGGGYPVSGLYNITQAGFTRPPDNYLTFAKDYGEQIENWQGIDFSVNARMRGVVTQGGISTGSRLTDSCEIRSALPETTPLNPYCRVKEPYLTQFKLASAYTIPGIDVQLAGTFQSIPGPVVQATVVYPAAALAPALGRPFVGGATAVVNVIPTATEYGDRLNQLDFRIGKLLRMGGLRTALNVDLFNAFNANAVLTENPSFALFRQPLSVLNPRLVKFSAQLDF